MSHGVLWPAHHLGSILSADCNNDGVLVSGGESNDVCIWDLANRSLIHQLQGFPAEITAVCLTNSFYFWLACDCDLMKFDLRNFLEPIQTLSVFDDDVNMILLNSSESILAACDDSGNVIVVDHTKKHNNILHGFKEHDSCVSAIEFNPVKSDTELFSSGTDAQLRSWNLSSGTCSDTVFLADCFAGDSATQTEEFGDTVTNVLTPPMVHSVSSNQSGTLLACGLENSGLLLFDIQNQPKFKTRALLMGHSAGVCQVVFPKFSTAANGIHGQDLLISGGNDKKIISWRCHTEFLNNSGDALNQNSPPQNINEQSLSSQSEGTTEEPMESCSSSSTSFPEYSSEPYNDVITESAGNSPLKCDQLRCFNHHNKINWFCCASSVKNIQPQLVVADLSSALSSYSLDSIFS